MARQTFELGPSHEDVLPRSTTTSTGVVVKDTPSSPLPVHAVDDTSTIRVPQWMYLGPIMAAPIAHICVSLYRTAKTPRQKQLLVGVGVVGSTVTTLGMRLYLMSHAGYAGGEMSEDAARERTRVVGREEREIIVERPSAWSVIREAFKGFG
mmetsp:Transcript_15900/g.32005  ORF Transcript_15900/g.32005 Transcript_15900/m.32005 type:complete len:152 (-) Transcript_15900:128-583(-)